ncbi:MAG: Sir2 family NAD+-dependent deacetylase [Pseudohongiellaceae bacterium]|nr:Sir2 family NAD+-dependent deacetylase [Pseudohongiellaceae bacterium]
MLESSHMTPRPRSIIILTGAGISAESGINTFRAADGLWENHAIEDVATPQGFARNPELVHHFYNQRRAQLLQETIAPNPAHFALAKLEREFPGEVLLVTQNVDNLHERAGSRKLLHMHGELQKMRCQETSLVFDADLELSFDSLCRCCQSQGNLRPHIVWFGEMPLHMNQITRALEGCDLFISIGTSGSVYPASGFYQIAKAHSAHTVEINLEETGSSFDEHHYGLASSLVPKFVDQLLCS